MGWKFKTGFAVILILIVFLLPAPDREKFFELQASAVLTDYDPVAAVGFATCMKKTVEAEVDDGALEVELVQRLYNPILSAIEIEKLD